MEKIPISSVGRKILAKQEELAKIYKYKAQPPLIAMWNMEEYYETIPEDYRNEKTDIDIGYEIKGKEFALYSRCGTLIARKYNRIVIGHYGAFIEINDSDIIKGNIKCQSGQEYRIYDPSYKDRVKYHWYTTIDDSNCKLYFQQKGVEYADYKIGKWYISPYEVLTQEEIKLLQIEKIQKNKALN